MGINSIMSSRMKKHVIVCLGILTSFVAPASADFSLESVLSKHSGCCSSHGGLSNSCQANGRAVCNDGWLGSSCACHPHDSGGNSSPPPPRRPSPPSPSHRPSPTTPSNAGKSPSRLPSRGSWFNFSGIYSGNLLVSFFQSNYSSESSFIPGFSKHAFRFLVDHKNSKQLLLMDEVEDIFDGSRIGRDSFEANELFETEPDCTVDVTYKLTRIESRKAMLHAIFEELCDSGNEKVIEFKGRVRRKQMRVEVP